MKVSIPGDAVQPKMIFLPVPLQKRPGLFISSTITDRLAHADAAVLKAGEMNRSTLSENRVTLVPDSVLDSDG